MAVLAESITSDLASIVGETHVVTEPSVCAEFAAGRAIPRCAVFPPSAQDVASILQYANGRRLAVIPCRNATKLSLGNRPQRYDIALSLKQMNNVWHYEPADLTVSVEPGMKFGDFQEFVGRNNLWLPLDPEGGARASIGGILAANSAGPLRYAYGSPRDMTLGMKIATAEGKIIKAGGRVVKNVAGYDLSKLLIGSFGTLGVIVEASFKLFPHPASRATFVFAVETLAFARHLRRKLAGSALPIARMALVNALAARWSRAGAETAGGAGRFEMWIETLGSERGIQRARHELALAGRENATQTREADEEQAVMFWERIADFRRRAIELQPDALVAKVSVLVSRQEEFLTFAEEGALSQKTAVAWIDQAGAGIIQLAIAGLRDPEHASALAERLSQAAEENGGTLVNVDAGPQAALPNFAWGKQGDDLPMMKAVKDMWDPQNILSPGRLLGGI